MLYCLMCISQSYCGHLTLGMLDFALSICNTPRNADVNDRELQTVFTVLESLMNSRPMKQVSGDTNNEPRF